MITRCEPRPGPGHAAWLAVAVLVTLLAGCGLTVPMDPQGTLDTVRGGVLRVGVSHSPPWTEVRSADARATDAEPGGIEPDLVRAFARTLDAEVRWTVGGEEQLLDELEEGRLDLVVGGLTVAPPRRPTATLTAVYRTTPAVRGPGGSPATEHVMAAPMGENAFLVALERFLLDVQPDVEPVAQPGARLGPRSAR